MTENITDVHGIMKIGNTNAIYFRRRLAEEFDSELHGNMVFVFVFFYAICVMFLFSVLVENRLKHWLHTRLSPGGLNVFPRPTQIGIRK